MNVAFSNQIKTQTQNSLNKSKQNNQSFKSNIHLLNMNKFRNVDMSGCSKVKFVDFPWTPNEIVKGVCGYTEDVKSCTAGGIITKNLDGSKDVVMFHLNPDQAESQDLKFVEDKLFEKLKDTKPIQALIAGSKDNQNILKYCGEYFDKIAEIINKLNIPITKLKGTPMGGHELHMIYTAPNDTWSIVNTARDVYPAWDDRRKGFTGFKEVVLSDLDHITYD